MSDPSLPGDDGSDVPPASPQPRIDGVQLPGEVLGGVIGLCGLVATAAFLYGGWSLVRVHSWGGDTAFCNAITSGLGYLLIGLGFTLGPAMFGIAEILHELKKR